MMSFMIIVQLLQMLIQIVFEHLDWTLGTLHLHHGCIETSTINLLVSLKDVILNFFFCVGFKLAIVALFTDCQRVNVSHMLSQAAPWHHT